jgi:hypothetical protein
VILQFLNGLFHCLLDGAAANYLNCDGARPLAQYTPCCEKMVKMNGMGLGVHTMGAASSARSIKSAACCEPSVDKIGEWRLADGVDVKAYGVKFFVIEDVATIKDKGRLDHRFVDCLVV